MSWLGTVAGIIANAFPGRGTASIRPPRGLEGARVSYVNEGRSGKVVFTQGLTRFEMYFEFGGGNTVATIDVPSSGEWLKRTGLSLAVREDVLKFIGESVVRDQTTRGSGRYEVHEGYISIHV